MTLLIGSHILRRSFRIETAETGCADTLLICLSRLVIWRYCYARRRLQFRVTCNPLQITISTPPRQFNVYPHPSCSGAHCNTLLDTFPVGGPVSGNTKPLTDIPFTTKTVRAYPNDDLEPSSRPLLFHQTLLRLLFRCFDCRRSTSPVRVGRLGLQRFSPCPSSFQ